MNKDKVDDQVPGTLIAAEPEPYYKPDPLPPSRQLSLDDQFYERLAEATFWLGRLSGLTTERDFAPVLSRSLLRKEAIESTEIDGTNVNYNVLYSQELQSLGETDRPNAPPAPSLMDTNVIQEVLNYEQAIRDGITAIDNGRALSHELFHELHCTLLSDTPDDRLETEAIGAYKTKPTSLGDVLSPIPELVDELMDALVTYYHTGGQYHPLIDIALFHYQFETIQPYGDENGRLGRLLILLQLYDTKLLEQPTLCLSEYFNRNQATYTSRMNAVRNDGEWDAWLSFFIKGVAKQAEESVTRILALHELQQEYEAEYAGINYTKNHLACSLFEHPYMTATTVANRFDIDHSTAYRAITTLEEHGLLEEVTSQRGETEYRATEIFDILEQPPQTY